MSAIILDKATDAGGGSEARGDGDGDSDIMTDIAVLVAVLEAQVTTASSEAEHWFMAFFDCLEAIEARIAQLRRYLPRTDEGGAVAEERIGAIEQMLMRALAGLQVQDILRQQLSAVTTALAALQRQCQTIASRNRHSDGADKRSDSEDVAAILSCLERTYVMQAQRAAHFRAITLHATR